MAFDLKQRLTRDALSAARIAAASRSCRPAGEPTRARQLGQLASEVLGSTATLEEFLVETVARELVELHLARGRPDPSTLVFPDSEGGHLRRQNWRRRIWIPALERAGIPYFRSYDLRHTCATLLLYEGRTLNEAAEHLGHADPGFTAQTYTHVMRDASKRRGIKISEAIRKARATASRRPLSPEAGESHYVLVGKVPGNRKSRRPDSNRGHLHYER